MAKLKYQTLRENVVDVIRLKILQQELTPGMRIIEQDLSEELGVSRAPIREALRQLEQEGMVVYKRNVGCSVNEITLDDIYEIYLLSSNYELLAVKEYDGKFSDEDIAEMEKILEQMKQIKEGDYENVVELDNKLHRLIIEKAGLGRLLKAWSDLNYGNYISCYAGKVDRKQTVARQYPIHKELVDACATRNTDTICKAITNHYTLTIKRLLEKGKKDESLEV